MDDAALQALNHRVMAAIAEESVLDAEVNKEVVRLRSIFGQASVLELHRLTTRGAVERKWNEVVIAHAGRTGATMQVCDVIDACGICLVDVPHVATLAAVVVDRRKIAWKRQDLSRSPRACRTRRGCHGETPRRSWTCAR